MEFIGEWGRIAGIAGIALGIFAVLFREVIRKNIFPKLSRKQSFVILLTFMLLVSGMSVFAIVKYYDAEAGMPGQITVLVRDEKGNVVLPGRGKVRLRLGDANPQETINDKGEATFKEIRPEFFEGSKTIKLEFSDPGGEPYHAVRPDSLYTITRGESIALTIKLDGLNSIRGIVKDLVTGELLEGVRISIGVSGVETSSDEHGEYILDIPPEHQRKLQTVRASKEGYKNYEKAQKPVQADTEFSIFMDPEE